MLISNEGTKGHVTADAVTFIPADKVPMPKDDAAQRRRSSRGRRPRSGVEEAPGERPEAADGDGVRSKKQMIEDTRVHIRGSVHNLGEPAPRGFLQVATLRPSRRVPARTRAAACNWPTGSPARTIR